MTEEAKRLRRQYLRDWRKANPEKSEEYSRRYWEKKAAKQAQKQPQQDNQSRRDET